MEKINSDYVRELYNKATKNNYEYWRWKSSLSRKKQYQQTLKSLLFHIGDSFFEDLLEVGCGPGTWTRILTKRCKNITIVDISEEMIKVARRRLSPKKVKCIVGDFQDPELSFPSKYDAIFCIRAIEYMDFANSWIPPCLWSSGTIYNILTLLSPHIESNCFGL